MKNDKMVTTQISEEKSELINDIQEAIEEFKLIKKGKLKSKSAKKMLDEL